LRRPDAGGKPVAEPLVAIGTSAQSTTSRASAGGSRRGMSGTRFAVTTSYAANGWKPGTAMRTPSLRRTIS